MKKICTALLICFLCLGSAQAAQLNKVAAVVNGQVITMFDLQRESVPALARAGLNPNDASKKKQVDKVLRDVLDMMVMDILVAQEAKRLKATVSPSEIDNELTKMMRARKMSKKQFEEQLAKQKLTVESVRKNLEKNLLRQKVMGMEVGRKVVVRPEEIKAYYDAHKDQLVNREGLHMGVLVYHPKADAKGVAQQIKAGKMTFAEACAKYSVAPNREKGGDAGPVEWERLNPEWEGRLTRMKPGDVTDLFDLQGLKAQVHLFRPGGGPEKQLSLKEATPQIDAILRQPKAKMRFEDYSKQLREKAVIDIRL